MKSISAYQIIGILLTFFIAFLMASNFGSYHQPAEVHVMRDGLLAELDKQAIQNPIVQEATDRYKNNIETSLTEPRYKQHSLFRIIGNFILLLGVVLLRHQKMIGLHLFIAGSIFIFFTGFYTLWFGIIGWVFNLFYMLWTLGFGLYFYSKRKEYI